MERESSKECSVSFLWTNESFSLWNCLSRNSTLFLHGGSECLACFEPTKAARFLKTLEVHSVLYDQRKVRFWKGIFVFIKVSGTFSTFWHRRETKTTKCAFEIDFFTMWATDLTCVNATIWLVLRDCFLGLTYGFLNKNFQEIKLFISFITLAQKTFLELKLKFCFLHVPHWIAIHFLIHYLPFKNFAVCRIQEFL